MYLVRWIFRVGDDTDGDAVQCGSLAEAETFSKSLLGTKDIVEVAIYKLEKVVLDPKGSTATAAG